MYMENPMKKDNKKNRQDEGWGIQKYCQETVNIFGPKTKCYMVFLLKPFTFLFLPFLLRFLSLPLHAQQHSPLTVRGMLLAVEG